MGGSNTKGVAHDGFGTPSQKICEGPPLDEEASVFLPDPFSDDTIKGRMHRDLDAFCSREKTLEQSRGFSSAKTACHRFQEARDLDGVEQLLSLEARHHDIAQDAVVASSSSDAAPGSWRHPANAAALRIIKPARYRELLKATSQLSEASQSANAAPQGQCIDPAQVGQMWSAAFKSVVEPPNEKDSVRRLKEAWSAAGKDRGPVAGGVARPNAQDDLYVEHFSVDRNLSEALYWSDNDTTLHFRTKIGGRHASAHRFRVDLRPLQTTVRSYVMQDLSEELDNVVAMLMLRLQRFSDLSVDKSPRRFALGLPEVSRRTRQLRVKCIIIAPDMCEAADKNSLDDRVRQVLAFAYKNDVHVIFALSRAGLGRAVGKSMHISIVGVLDATGANDLLEKAVALAQKNQQSWLMRYEQAPAADTPTHPGKRAGNLVAAEVWPQQRVTTQRNGKADAFSAEGSSKGGQRGASSRQW